MSEALGRPEQASAEDGGEGTAFGATLTMPGAPQAAAPRAAPGLAFVLGSGGVRSIAAIGIADRLLREGIRADLVVGCSSGALFGAQIALGMEKDAALRMATTLWSPELTRRRRWRAYAQMALPRLAGFDEAFAMRDDGLIAERIGQAFGKLQLEDLPMEMRVATTDAATGDAVVLKRGSLAQALRASIAVPIIFPSVEIDGRRLVDGVMSDPLPVGAAADASVVLALGFRGAMPRRVDRLSRMVAQTSTTLINNLMQARVAAAEAQGQHVINMELALDRHVGLWDTSALPYLFEAGQRAAEACLSRIEAALAQRQGGTCNAPEPDFKRAAAKPSTSPCLQD